MISPVIVTTWPFGIPACKAAWNCLTAGGSALEAVEVGANVTEDDPAVTSVGTGALPNSDGVVELDAAIMDGLTHAAGSVAGLTETARPISVARRILECTPHVMLVGDNAVRFARAQGFPRTELLTGNSCKRWEEWKRSCAVAEVAHFEALTPDNHDTIGLCALDRQGNLAAGCTTSGMAWKMPGRVGDSPIIGSGLYVDNKVGAAAATGYGDEMMKAVVSYRVIMLMELGHAPEEACAESLRYLLRKRPPEDHNDYGAAIIAVRKDGCYGAAATRSGFRSPDRLWNWAVGVSSEPELREGPYVTPDTIVASLVD